MTHVHKRKTAAPLKIEVDLIPKDQAPPDDVKLDFEKCTISMEVSIPFDENGNPDRQKMLKMLLVTQSMKKLQGIMNSDTEDRNEQLQKLSSSIRAVIERQQDEDNYKESQIS